MTADNYGGLLNYAFDQLPFLFLVLLIAFACHEFAHAYTADKFGDPTPRMMGRVTLNPRVHINWLGMLLIFLVGFGWAKPVIIKPGNFKKPRLMSIIVSVAGPLANLILAFLGMLCVYLLAYYGIFDSMSAGVYKAVRIFLLLTINLNFMLFLFNLIPLPPLDGYRILSDALPLKARLVLQQYEQWAIYLFLLIVFIPGLYDYTLGKLFSLVMPGNGGNAPLFYFFDDILRSLFGKGVNWSHFL